MIDMESSFSTMNRRLDKIYKILNESFFNSELEQASVRVVPSDRRYVSIDLGKEIMSNTDSSKHVVMDISSKELSSPAPLICAGMLHEMVHLYNHIHNIKDTSRGGTYHNQQFKSEAMRRGLNVSRDAVYGYCITTPKTCVSELCKSAGISDFDVYEYDKYARIKAENKHSKRYVCPCCGQVIYATKTLSAQCNKCDAEFAERPKVWQ